MTNLALIHDDVPVVPIKHDAVCFFFRALLKSDKCLIAKTFFPLQSPFRFQALFAFFSAMTFETSEPLARLYPLKADRWRRAKWRQS